MYGDTHKKCRIQGKPLSVRSKLNGTPQLQIRDPKLQSFFGYRWVLALRDTEVSCSISGPPDKALCVKIAQVVGLYLYFSTKNRK